MDDQTNSHPGELPPAVSEFAGPGSCMALLAALVFCALLLSPYFTVSRALPAFRPEELIALLIIAVSFFYPHFGMMTFKALRVAWPLLGFACAMMLTAFAAAILPNASFTPRDLMEVFYPVKYVVFILAGTLAGTCISSRQKDFIVSVVVLAGLIAAGFGLGQFLGLKFVMTRLSPLYILDGGQSHLHSMEFSGRVIGTTGNPNHFASILGFAMLAAIGSLAGGGSRRITAIVLLLLAPLVLVATISRVNYIAVPLAMIVLLKNMSQGRRSWGYQLKLLMILGSVVIVGYFCFNLAGEQLRNKAEKGPSAFEKRVASFMDFSPHGAYSIRFRHFQTKLARWVESPFLGIGAAKSGKAIGADNEYFSMLAKYGLFGACMLFLFYFKAYRALKSLVRASGSQVQFFAVVGVSFTIQILLENLTGGVFYHGQVFGLFSFTLGLAMGFRQVQPAPSAQQPHPIDWTKY